MSRPSDHRDDGNGIAGVFYAVPIALVLWAAIVAAVLWPTVRLVELAVVAVAVAVVFVKGERK